MGKRLERLKAKAKRLKQQAEDLTFKLKKAKLKGESIYWKTYSALIQAKREGRKLRKEIQDEMRSQFGNIGTAEPSREQGPPIQLPDLIGLGQPEPIAQPRQKQQPFTGGVGEMVLGLPPQPKPKKRKKKRKRKRRRKR